MSSSSSILNNNEAYALYELGKVSYMDSQAAAARLATGIKVKSPEDDPTRYQVSQNLSSRALSNNTFAENNEVNKQNLSIASQSMAEIYKIAKEMQVPATKALGTSDTQDFQLTLDQNYNTINSIINNTVGVSGTLLLDGSLAATGFIGNSHFIESGKGQSTINFDLGTSLDNIFSINDVYFSTAKTGSAINTAYNSRYITESFSVDLGNFVKDQVVTNFLNINGVNFSTVATASATTLATVNANTTAGSIKLDQADADATALAAELKTWINTQTSVSASKLEGFSAKIDANDTSKVIISRSSIKINGSTAFSKREDVAYDVIYGANSSKIISGMSIGNKDITSSVYTAIATSTQKVNADTDYSFGTISKTAEIKMNDAIDAAATKLFTINYTKSDGTSGTMGFNLADTTANAAALITLKRGVTGKELAVALKDAINSSSLGTNGFRATSNSSSVFISRYDSAGSESYDIKMDTDGAVATADISISNLIVDNIEYGAQKTDADSTVKVQADHREVISIGDTTKADIAKKISDVIAFSGQNSSLSPRAQKILSSMSATEDTDNILSIDANKPGFSEQIFISRPLDESFEVGDFGRTKVGSLGISNTVVSGAPSGSSSLIKWNSQDKVSSTDWVEIDTSKIKENSTFSIGSGSGKKTFTFNSFPSDNSEYSIQIVKLDGGEEIDYKATINNLVNVLNKSIDPTIYSLNYQLREGVNSTEINISGKTSTSTLNGLSFSFSSGISDTTPSIFKLSGGISSGIDVSGVQNNSGFVGRIDSPSISATHKGNGVISLNINVGGVDYSAEYYANQIVDNIVRFSSTEKGYFEITFAGGEGSKIENQDQANAYSVNLGKTLSGFLFSQTRNIENYQPNGSLLVYSKVEYTSDSFNDNSKVTKVSVFSTSDDPKSTNKGYIELEVEGAGTFKNYVPEDKSFQVIKPGQQVTLYLDGDINSNKKVSIYFGESIDLGNKEICNQLQDQLSSAFKSGAGPLTFYLSTNLADPSSLYQVAIPNMRPGQKFDLSTKENTNDTIAFIKEYEKFTLKLLTQVGQSEQQVNAANALLLLQAKSLKEAAETMTASDTGKDLQNSIVDAQKSQMAMRMFAQSLKQQTQMMNTIIGAAAS